MEIKDYNGRLCSFKYANKEYLNVLIIIGSESIWFINDSQKNHIRRGVPMERFKNIILGRDDVFTDFKLNKEITNNKTMENLGVYNGKSCSFNYMDRTYQNILIKINNDNVHLMHNNGQKFTTLKFDKFIKLLTSSGRFDTYSNFKIMNSSINNSCDQYHDKLCSFTRSNRTYNNRKILLRSNHILLKGDGLDGYGDIALVYNEFIKALTGKSRLYTNFKLIEDKINNNTMIDLSIYDGKLCKFNYKRNSYENILIKINDNHVDLIQADGLKFMGLSFDLFTKIVNKYPNFTHIIDFKLTEDKTELKTIEDYKEKYDGKLCTCNGVKYTITIDKFIVCLNYHIVDSIFSRRMNIYEFIYLLNNGRTLNNSFCDFKILESEKKKITMREISEKFNIDVNDIEIVK